MEYNSRPGCSFAPHSLCSSLHMPAILSIKVFRSLRLLRCMQLQKTCAASLVLKLTLSHAESNACVRAAVVVQKRHHTRLFPTDRSMTDRSGNVQPGAPRCCPGMSRLHQAEWYARQLWS